MKLRFLPVQLTVLTATLAASSLHPTQAQDGPPTPPPPPPPRREGGFGAIPEDGPRGDGNRDGGPREGGGGPREGGGRGPDGGNRPNETPEQRNARTLASYVEMIPDLSEAQKTHITIILNAVTMEAAAIGADDTLSPERKIVVGRALRASVGERIKSALTDAQLAEYMQQQNDRVVAAADMQKIIADQVGDDMQATRERAIKGYEDFLEGLSVKQKTQILKFLETADIQATSINADSTTTPAQKKEALLKIHDALSAQVTPLLDAEQAADWKKAHDAKRPQ